MLGVIAGDVIGTSCEAAYREFGREHPNAGYGGFFYDWLHADDPRPYNSWGNGSAMRVAPVGFAFDNLDDVLREAERSAIVTHNHAEGIKGAQATELAVFIARSGGTCRANGLCPRRSMDTSQRPWPLPCAIRCPHDS